MIEGLELEPVCTSFLTINWAVIVGNLDLVWEQ